jgi:hypothetical protein
MRRLEFARPPRTATGHARNAGEAVQQLAHVARERQRLAQERKSLVRRILKIDARLEAITATEGKLMPMIQVEAQRPKDSPPTSAPAPPPPPPKRQTPLPLGLSEVTLQY